VGYSSVVEDGFYPPNKASQKLRVSAIPPPLVGNVEDMPANMFPIITCGRVFDDSQHAADTVTGSQSWSHVGIFCDMTFAKLIQS
jgi:hypothetical protein